MSDASPLPHAATATQNAAGNYESAVAAFMAEGGNGWAALPFFDSGEALAIAARVDARQAAGAHVLPPPQDLLTALRLTRRDMARVVILGQDPYPTPGDAHGLAFSVNPQVPAPRSLRNIFRELADDLGASPPLLGDLRGWASQGVLLLNASLTVEAGAAGAHRGWGWERLAHEVVTALAAGASPTAFILWGADARRFAADITVRDAARRHLVIESAHPSPLSARRGFFGSKPFSRVNAFLSANGLAPIDWTAAGAPTP